MLNIDQIQKLLRQQQMPYISLSKVVDYGRQANAGRYSCENCDKDESFESKTEKAIEWLQSHIMLFPEDSIFILTARKNASANQSGVLGPFKFSVYGKSTDREIQAESNNLNGLDFHSQAQNLGYVPQAQLTAALTQQQLEHERELNKREINLIKKEFQNSQELILEKANMWSPEKISAIAQEIGLLAGVFTGKVNPELLGGTKQIENKTTDPTEENILMTKLHSELSNFNQRDQSILIGEFLRFIKKTKENLQNRKTQEQSQTEETEQ